MIGDTPVSGWTWNSKEEDTYRSSVQSKLDGLDEKLEAVLEQTTRTNGRMNKAEVKIAVLMLAYGIGSAAIAWLVAR